MLNFKPQSPITIEGLRTNCSIAIQYLGAWLAGNGCVPINNLMEDAATAGKSTKKKFLISKNSNLKFIFQINLEISRAQVWNWIQSNNGKLDDGQKITKQMVQQVMKEELNKIEQNNPNKLPFRKAAEIFEQMCTKNKLEDFLTIPLYKHF